MVALLSNSCGQRVLSHDRTNTVSLPTSWFRTQGNKEGPLFGMFTWTLPTWTFKRASLLDCSVMAFVCPHFGKFTRLTLASKRASLVNRDVAASVYNHTPYDGQVDSHSRPRESPWVKSSRLRGSVTIVFSRSGRVLQTLVSSFFFRVKKTRLPLGVVLICSWQKWARTLESLYLRLLCP